MTVEAYASAAKQLLRNFNVYRGQWRHHGLGMLQAEIDEELRVHIWHPRLVTLEGMRAVHDHRFTLTSFVAVGTIIDVPYTVVEERDHSAFEYAKQFKIGQEVEINEVVHAKAQGTADAPIVRSLGKAYAYAREPMRFTAGSRNPVYTIACRDFHTTRIEALAITLVHRSQFDDKPARVLGLTEPGDVGKGSAIVPESPETQTLRWEVLDEANDALVKLRPRIQ